MWKLIKIILILLLALGILFFVIISYLDVKMLGDKTSSFEKDLSKIESLIPEEEKDKIQYKKFITPDGKLELEYLSDWIEIKDKESLSGAVSEEIKEKYNFKTLFLASNLKKQVISNLIVSEGFFGPEKDFEQILDIMKEANQKEGLEMEIIKSEVENNECVFEAVYIKTGSLRASSKEKIILLNQEGEKKAYMIAFVVHAKDWQEFEEEANNIINSAKLVD